MNNMHRLVTASMASVLLLILVLGTIPALNSASPLSPSIPEAQAQTTTQSAVTINGVSGDTASFTVKMTAPTSMNMTRLTLTSKTKLATRPADSVKGITIGGISYPVSSMSATANTVTVNLPNGVKVQSGTPIVLKWAKGEKNNPTASDLTASMEGTPSGPTAPEQGSPINADTHRIANKRDDDECSTSNGMLYSKTWWDNSRLTEKYGGLDIVEVKAEGISDLINKIKTTEGRSSLKIGDTNLTEGKDYTLTVDGNSIYFVLKQTQQRAPLDRTSYDVEARIALTETQTSCGMTLWHKGNLPGPFPEWFDPEAPDLELNAPETPREQLAWLPKASPNPTAPERCGSNIALVFDSSDSMSDNNGVEGSVQAGLGVIDALQGTSSNMAIYNFASAEKSVPGLSTDTLSLNDPQDTQKLRNAVESFAKPYDRNGRGGTNYEAGLKQIPAGEFDVVYFITDGLPTTSNRDYPGFGFDVGTLVNQSDLSRAVKEANRLKDSGTRIETLMVGFPPFNEHILKDDYFGLSNVKKDPDNWPYLEGYGYPSYYGQGGSVREKLEGGGEISIWDSPRDGISYPVRNQPEIWRAGIRNTRSMGADISSADAVTTLDSFGKLTKALRDLVLKNCFGSINVTKMIHSQDGTLTPGENWIFDTSVDSGNKEIIDGADKSARQSRVTDSTNEEGNYGRTFDQSNGRGQSVTVVEHQQEGYDLRQVDGKNAVCTKNELITDANGSRWETSPVEVRNVDNAKKPGFGVDVPFRGIVNCTVENETVPVKIDLSVEKVGFDNTKQPLSGAEFTLYELDGDNRDEIKVIRDGDTRVLDLKPGRNYELVETQAPNGYQLLPHTIKFKVVQNGAGTPTIEINGGAEQYPEVSVQVDSTDSNHSILQVADIRKGDLPKTGGSGLGWIVIVAGALAAAAFVAGRRALS